MNTQIDFTTDHDPDEDGADFMDHPIEKCAICEKIAEASYDYWSGS